MEINKRLRRELEEILERKSFGLTLEELAQEFEKAGRSAPCVHFSGLGFLGIHPCKLGHELDCLTCSHYEPHERPGLLESATCEFSAGKVYHMMRFAESDGFYRWGETLCGRLVDEAIEDVEIYDFVPSGRLCKKCEAESKKLK